MIGQLLDKERKFLYDTVLKAKPKTVLEIGTWKGGGSTYQIMSALKANDFGHLVTCETDKCNWLEASKLYENIDIVDCRNEPSTVVIRNMIQSYNIPDFLFWDGPEDPELNLEDLKLLEPYLVNGAIFCAHDWDLDVRIDGQISIKSKLVRPYIETSDNWDIVETISKPISVGMVVARYNGHSKH